MLDLVLNRFRLDSQSWVSSRIAFSSAINVALNATRSAASIVDASSLVLFRARSIEALMLLMLSRHAPSVLTKVDKAAQKGTDGSEKKNDGCND